MHMPFLTNDSRVWFYMSYVTLLFFVHTNKRLVSKLHIIFGVLSKFCAGKKILLHDST